MTFSLPPDTPKGQSDAITASDRTIAVTAGAGTGKTWVLTERYLRLLMDDHHLLPADILTLTYTEAAAGEMKSRITHRIEEALQDFPDPERKRELLDGLSDVWISTIHSFAARLIRESGLSLDIDPRASVITTQQEEDFWNSIRSAAEFAKLEDMARHYGSKELRKAAQELDKSEYFSYAVSKWKAGVLAEFARDTAELHASSGRTWQEMLGWTEDDVLIASAKPQVRSILAEEWQDVRDFWERHYPLPEANKGTRADNLNHLLDDMHTHAIDELAFYVAIMTNENVSRALNVTPVLGYALGAWRNSRSQKLLKVTINLDADLSPEELTMRQTLLKFCAVCWGMWDIMKTKRGLLSFSDMINHARTAIQDAGITRKFRHILVDEFQDTDPLQYGMITSLQQGDTSMFVVGDPKQSIYRFRHADPSLFARTIIEADKTIELDTSFRTRKALIDRINTLFREKWRYGLGKSSAMNGLTYKLIAPVTAGTERDSGTMPPFEVLLAENTGGTLDHNRKILAENLARKIYGWVNDGKTIWDKKDKLIRPVKFSDFAILTPSRSIFPILEDALSRFGIKSIRDRSGGFFGRGEINDIVCLLRAAADFNDDFAVSGWFMSPFSGVNGQQAANYLPLVDKDTRPIELIREKFPEAYSRLEYCALVGEVEGPAGLIAILDRNRSWLSCYKPSDRMRVLRNVRLAVSIAREFQQSGTSGLRACAEWLTRAVRDEVEYEEPAWHDDNENAVRLGSVHSAKGLEYPVAIVFDQRVKKRPEMESLLPSRELGLVFKGFPDEVLKGQTLEPKLKDWESLLSEQGEAEEQARLFYVACTRAQDSLIFCGLLKVDSTGAAEPYKDTWTKLLMDNYADFEPETVHELYAKDFPKNAGQEQEHALRSVRPVEVRTPLRQISASSFAMFEWCPFAWRRSYRQGLTLSWETPADYNDDEPGGAELGSLAHWVLARWPRGEDYAERIDYWLYDDEVLAHMPGDLRQAWRKQDKKTLREWLMRFAESELGVMMRTQKFEREKSFRLPLNSSTIMAGAIDAVCGNRIIDYKITSVERAPKELYESQLDFYAFVRHEQTGADSVRADIAFLREGRTDSRDITDFEAIRARIERAAETCGSGPFAPRSEHCGICPFKEGCVKNIAGIC